MKKQKTKDAVDQFFIALKKSIPSQGDTMTKATQIAKSADQALQTQATTIEALAKTLEAFTQKVDALSQPKTSAPIQKSVTHVAPEAHPLNGQANGQDDFIDSPALIQKAMNELQKSNDKARQHDLSRAVSLLTIGANPTDIRKQYNL